MADITSISELTGEDALTERQINKIINRINIAIYNITAGKFDAVDHTEFGVSGNRTEPSKTLAQYRNLLKFYKDMLEELPVYEVSQYDNPEQ